MPLLYYGRCGASHKHYFVSILKKVLLRAILVHYHMN